MDFSIRANNAELNTLVSKLKSISDDLKYKGGRAALRKAANVMRLRIANSAKGLVDDPRTAEDISKNVAIRWSSKTFKKTGNLGFRVGILGGAKFIPGAISDGGKGKGNPGGDTWYWRLVEFGFKDIPAKPFVRPAFENSQGDAVNVFFTEYEKSIDRAIARARKG